MKTLIITFLRLAGVEADEESALWMLGKVRDPYMKRYIDAILQARAQDKKNPEGTIIADIVARDLPTEKQASNDSGHGGRSDMIAEVKTMQPGKNAYEKGNSQDNKPVNQRAKRVTKDYRNRAAKLDRKLAPDEVGTRTNGQVGPFEAALGEFYTGNVFPIVVGAFGEVNEDANKLIKKLARLTAKTDFGKSMSPLVSHSRKGGAFPIMQSQFLRALGCLTARRQAQHLLKRRHDARPSLSGLLDSAREAYLTAEDNPPSAMTTYNMVDHGHKEQ